MVGSYLEETLSRGTPMNIIKFPGKNKQKQSPNISPAERQSIINEFMDILDESCEIETIDLADIDKNQFRKYLKNFQCFSNFSEADLDPINLYQLYEKTGILTEEEEVIFLFILELISGYEFGFIISEIFEFCSNENQSNFIKVLAYHSMVSSSKELSL